MVQNIIMVLNDNKFPKPAAYFEAILHKVAWVQQNVTDNNFDFAKNSWKKNKSAKCRQ